MNMPPLKAYGVYFLGAAAGFALIYALVALSSG